jgi:trimeric autotransporter adhesin
MRGQMAAAYTPYSNGIWTPMSGSMSSVNSMLTADSNLYAGGYSGVAQLLISPNAPANLQAGSTTSASNTLTWDAVSGAMGYKIYGDNNAIDTVIGATYSYTVSGLTPNTPYTFTVSAFNAAGESDQSGAIQVLTAPNACLTASAGNGQVTLNWNPASGAVTYIVYEGTASGFPMVNRARLALVTEDRDSIRCFRQQRTEIND